MMLLSTLANQMEMFALGVLSHKGTDLFTLFASNDADSAFTNSALSLDQVQEKWGVIADGSGIITQEGAQSYLDAQGGTSLLSRLISTLDQYLNISGDITNLAMLLGIVAMFIALSSFASRYFAQLVATRVSRDLRQAYFEHIQSLPMSFYHKYNIGSLSARVVGDAGQVALSINAILINYIHTPFTAISTLIICFYMNTTLSLIVFLGLPLILGPIVFIARRVKSIALQMQGNQENFASVLIDFLSGIQTVKVFGMEPFSLRKYCEQNDQMAVLEEKSARYSYAARPVIHMVGTGFLVFVLLYALYVEKMALPEILVYCGMLHLFYEPVKKFAEENNNIQRGVAAAERMFEVLDLKPQIEDHDGALEMTGFNHEIEFDDVWFRYEDEWILKGVSFTIKKGEFVALVGPTGAGKSTIANLLPRLYEVEKGEIRIDGRPLSAYTQRSLRECIAFVPQKPFLFLDSVKENISYGREFSDELVKNAAKRAHADEFIENLSDSYNTMLLEAGKNLSGGQQQRLAIARALVKNAPILLMDEPTSALDSGSEMRIKMALKELQNDGMTQILIAHRLSTIEEADKIIYLENGEKIAEGTKDVLLSTCPAFKLVWEMSHYSEDGI